MIRIENISKMYNTKDGNVIALKNVNVTIQDGEIFGLIGMSGAGKSTFLRSVGLLNQPTSGKIYVDDIDIYSLNAKDKLNFHRNISIIFQGYQLLMQRTVKENIQLPLELANTNKKEMKEQVQRMIKLVQLEGKENAYPSQLSGGQKQRVAIARALVTNPKILLCDEPTSALDSLTTKAILTLLKQINQQYNVTILIITHEIAAVKEICEKVAVIDQAQIVETGFVREVFKNPKTEITKLLLGKGSEK